MTTSSNLPIGWALTTIGEIASSPVDQAGPSETNEFTYIDISSIEKATKQIIDAKSIPVTHAPSRARQRVEPNDVLVSMTRPNLNAVAIVPNALSGAIASTGFDVLRAPEINPRWLFYLVQTNEFVAKMSALVQGALYPAVRPKDIRSYELDLPPRGEQDRIVAVVDALVADLDAAITTLKRVQAKLKGYRASVLKAASEGRLVPTEAELARKEGRSYETGEQLLARILKERRAKWESEQLAKMLAADMPPKNDDWKKKYKQPMPPVKASLPELPDGWTWANIGQLAAPEENSITDGPFGSNLKTEHYTQHGPLVVRLQNIGDGVFRENQAHISEERYERLKKHAVFPGDIVIAALGDPAPRACILPELGPAIVKADCIRLKTARGVVPAYVMFALNSEGVRKRTTERIHGVGRPRLNLQEIREIAVPLPPTEEQRRIVDAVEMQLSTQMKTQEVCATQLSRADRLRQAILKKAFQGKLVPQDPNDEPASALLARILAHSKTREAQFTRPPGRKRIMARERKAVRKSLMEVLKAASAPLSTEQLFDETGYAPSTVDEFYAELKLLIEAHEVEEIRTKDDVREIRVRQP